MEEQSLEIFNEEIKNDFFPLPAIDLGYLSIKVDRILN